MTASRALLEMVLSDPQAGVATFRTACQELLEESRQQEQLIDALLALARGQRGVNHRETVDLAETVARVLEAQRPLAAERELHVDAAVEDGPASAPVSGDQRLIERLISNLLDNAIRHNIDGGAIHVRVTNRAPATTLTVINTGPRVPPEEIDRLLQPFQRLIPDRVEHERGLGLGLSIVAAIAHAHGAQLVIVAPANGGLEVDVHFASPNRAEAPPRLSAEPLLS